MSDDRNSLPDYEAMSAKDIRNRARALDKVFPHRASIIAQIITEDARIEGGKVANVTYLAVKIAETLEK